MIKNMARTRHTRRNLIEIKNKKFLFFCYYIYFKILHRLVERRISSDTGRTKKNIGRVVIRADQFRTANENNRINFTSFLSNSLVLHTLDYDFFSSKIDSNYRSAISETYVRFICLTFLLMTTTCQLI